MANWIIYPVDAVANRKTLGVQVGATEGNAYSPNAVDLNSESLWLPGTTDASRIYFDTGLSKDIDAAYIGNHNLSGATVAARKDNSFGNAAGAGVNHALTDSRDRVLAFASNGEVNGRYFSIGLTSHSASAQIGTVALLETDERIEIDEGGPRFPIGQDISGGFVTVVSGSGASDPQVIGGVRQGLHLNLTYVPMDGDIGEDIQDSLHDHNGWANGVVVTGDAVDLEASPYNGRAYYCEVAGPITSGIQTAGGRATFTIPLLEKSKGMQ